VVSIFKLGREAVAHAGALAARPTPPKPAAPVRPAAAGARPAPRLAASAPAPRRAAAASTAASGATEDWEEF